MTAPPDPGVGPFADLLGIRRAAMAGGRARFELSAGAPHLNPHGVVHGGVVYTLVDYAMGGAVTSGLQPGERCASTSNRNFEGRQGKGGRTHLVSPPMAAAAAIAGHLVDVRAFDPDAVGAEVH